MQTVPKTVIDEVMTNYNFKHKYISLIRDRIKMEQKPLFNYISFMTNYCDDKSVQAEGIWLTGLAMILENQDIPQVKPETIVDVVGLISENYCGKNLSMDILENSNCFLKDKISEMSEICDHHKHFVLSTFSVIYYMIRTEQDKRDNDIRKYLSLQ